MRTTQARKEGAERDKQVKSKEKAEAKRKEKEDAAIKAKELKQPQQLKAAMTPAPPPTRG